jgi:hypothetical protein
MGLRGAPSSKLRSLRGTISGSRKVLRLQFVHQASGFGVDYRGSVLFIIPSIQIAAGVTPHLRCRVGAGRRVFL